MNAIQAANPTIRARPPAPPRPLRSEKTPERTEGCAQPGLAAVGEIRHALHEIDSRTEFSSTPRQDTDQASQQRSERRRLWHGRSLTRTLLVAAVG